MQNRSAGEHRFWAFIAAAGAGARMGEAVPKQYLDLAGVTVLERSIRALADHPAILGVLVGIAPDDAIFAKSGIEHTKLIGTVSGGATRAETVARGLGSLLDHADHNDWVMVHDAARPLVSHSDIDALVAAINAGAPGAVPGWPVVDSLARADSAGQVNETVERAGLWRTATPQTFRINDLSAALASGDAHVTDELSAMRAAGRDAIMIECGQHNFKLTTPDDLERARQIVTTGTSAARIGTGYDVHAFEAGRRLVLGGVTIEHSHGLAGHSDADVLLHAICDALLGAAALGDIGHHFPDTDPRFAGADSRVLLRHVGALLDEHGFVVGNIDSVVMAEAPKLAPHVAAMQANITADLGLGAGCVSVKATTTEGLGFVGRREGIAAQASATLASRHGV